MLLLTQGVNFSAPLQVKSLSVPPSEVVNAAVSFHQKANTVVVRVFIVAAFVF